MIRTSYDRGQRCALFMEQEVFQFFVDCAHATHQSNRSTKTWIVPPQESPIFSKFSSSEMPNSSICGFPSLMTSIAASTTAGSTQPPLTEPVNSPLSLTASFAPGLRGAEPYMLTTVATATRSPCSRQRSTSGKMSRIETLLIHTLWACSIRPQPCAGSLHCAPAGCRQSPLKDSPG